MKLLKALPLMAALLFGAATTSHAQVGESRTIFFAVGDVIADAGPDQNVTLPTGGSVSVTMDGSLTLALVPGASIVSYVWFDGTTTKTGLFPTFTYSVAGIYTIALVATDNLGNSATASMMVTVTDGNSNPLAITPAVTKAVECDGQGNLVAFNLWLETHGGSVASGGSPPITWTDNYTGNTMWVLGTCPVDEQVTVTFTAADATGATQSTTATFQIKDTTAPPLCWTVNGNPVADFTILTAPTGVTTTVKVLPKDICSGSTLQKSYTFLQGNGTVTYSSSVGGTVNDTVTLSNATNNSRVRFYFKATDTCGNSSAIEWVEIDTDKKTVALKGNEGLGNGVDPDTPGALHNGNNDAPGFYPGNPGAKHKAR
jgi:hypothetical protein